MSLQVAAISNEELKLRAQPLAADQGDARRTSSPRAAFATVFRRMTASVGGSEEAQEARARQAAEEFVAIALVQPILANLRDSPLVADEERGPLARGTGEKMMQPLWDAQAALEIVRASNWPMVDRLAQQLLQRAHALSASTGKEVDRHA